MCWRVCVNNFIFIQVKTGNKCITAGGSGMSCFGNLSSGDGLPLLKNSAGIFVFFLERYTECKCQRRTRAVPSHDIGPSKVRC